MSFSTELPVLEPQHCENDGLSQHLVQPEAAYWLTSESPIARAVSIGTSIDHRSSTTYVPAPAAVPFDSRRNSENLNVPIPEPIVQEFQFDNSLSHLHMSELEAGYAEVPSGLPWIQPEDRMLLARPYSNLALQPAPTYLNNSYLDSNHFQEPYSPYSTPSLYDDSPLQSPYLSSPELCSTQYLCSAPRSSPHDDYDVDDEDEDDVSDGKPYARLIYEALLQAPGHRMMLRDIYEWFEQNTNKPRESGSNGWQNSIRHNLSMNKAFENDKTQSTNARGQPKKATSVWFLTREALMHGVQSTTRYRKTGGVRKTGLGGSPDYRRQRSGAKGGRAARRAARLRRLEQSHSSWTPIVTPEDAGSFNHLVHAVNYLADYPPNYDSSPPTPSENFPYTPKSPVQRYRYCIDGTSGGKPDTMGPNGDERRSQDILYQHRFDAPLDDPW